MSRIGWLIAATALCIFSWRLFHSPIIGLANNGDFGKIAGPLRLGPASGPADDRFHFVTRDYKRAPEYAWDSRYYSSESLFALAAYELSALFQQRDRFDIRWMGLLHIAVWMAALIWLMAALRSRPPVVQIAAGLAVVCIFSDAAYLVYCNTFYTDAAAIAGLLLVMAASVDLAVRGSSLPRLAGFLVGALMLETSKTQHAFLALPLAILVWVIVRNRTAVAVGLALVTAAPLYVAAPPASYRAEPVFNLVFYKLTPNSPAPLQDLTALGLDTHDLRWVGTHSYSPGSPVTSVEYELAFLQRVTVRRIVSFYLSHPKRALAILWHDLADHASQIQLTNFGNYTADSGHPPDSQAPAFWSVARGHLMERAPWLAPLWLLGVAAVCLKIRSKTAWICLAVTVMTAMEFAIASLLDALDTSRHLFLFQVLTEITICFAVTAAARLTQQIFQLNASVGPRISILHDNGRVDGNAPVLAGPAGHRP